MSDVSSIQKLLELLLATVTAIGLALDLLTKWKVGRQPDLTTQSGESTRKILVPEGVKLDDKKRVNAGKARVFFWSAVAVLLLLTIVGRSYATLYRPQYLQHMAERLSGVTYVRPTEGRLTPRDIRVLSDADRASMEEIIQGSFSRATKGMAYFAVGKPELAASVLGLGETIEKAAADKLTSYRNFANEKEDINEVMISGIVSVQLGEPLLAIECFRRACRIRPNELNSLNHYIASTGNYPSEAPAESDLQTLTQLAKDLYGIKSIDYTRAAINASGGYLNLAKKAQDSEEAGRLSKEAIDLLVEALDQLKNMRPKPDELIAELRIPLSQAYALTDLGRAASTASLSVKDVAVLKDSSDPLYVRAKSNLFALRMQESDAMAKKGLSKESSKIALEAVSEFETVLNGIVEPRRLAWSTLATAHFSLGNAFMAKREIKKALKHSDTALQTWRLEDAGNWSQDFISALYLSGSASLLLGQYEKSLDRFQEVLSLAGHDSDLRIEVIGSRIRRLKAIQHLVQTNSVKEQASALLPLFNRMPVQPAALKKDLDDLLGNR